MNVLDRVLALDHALSARLTIRQTGLLRVAAQVIAHTGDSGVWIAIGLGLWALNQPQWAARVAITVFTLIGIVAALKLLFRRGRPIGEHGKLYLKLDAHSFPSGHAARMAALAVTCGALDPTLGLAFGMWATLVCLARVALGVHYLSDVTVGAAIGISAGAILVALL